SLTLAGVTGTLRQDGKGWHIEGDVKDPQWGDWGIRGDYDPATKAATMRLSTDRTDVTRKRLRALPFVMPAIWDQVEVEGPTQAVEARHPRLHAPGRSADLHKDMA